MYAEWQVGQVLWSMLWFFLFFMLIWVVVMVFSDIFRSRDLSGWGKALWTLFIIFLPWLGVFVYLLARGQGMADRRYSGAYAYGAEPPMGYYSAPPPAPAGAMPASPAGDLSALADLHDRGVIDDAEFQAMKHRVVAS
jgi:hypothetical protein